MSIRLERALKGLVLIGLALFLTSSIRNGTLLFYINRRFAWLTWIATILLVLIAFAYQRTALTKQNQDHDHDDDHDDVHDHHAHPHGRESAWIPLALVALPLLLGLLVPPRPLGARAVEGREVNTDGVGLENDEPLFSRSATERNILDWLRAFDATGDPSLLNSEEATVVGFVYRDDSFPDDQFMVSRFVVSCCVADATVVGLVVRWPDSRDLPVDGWVAVRGAFEAGQFKGEPSPILIAYSVRPIGAPNPPYLYP